jgi:hypothetical protein
MQTFTYGEFVSLAIAKVWSRTADLPPIDELWRRYAEVYKARKGYGKHFQFLGTEGTRSKHTPTLSFNWPLIHRRIGIRGSAVLPRMVE